MEIEKELPVLELKKTLKKGLGGGSVGVVALAVMACFHGLSPEQYNAGLVVSIGILEVLRNTLKRVFPRLFSFF